LACRRGGDACGPEVIEREEAFGQLKKKKKKNRFVHGRKTNEKKLAVEIKHGWEGKAISRIEIQEKTQFVTIGQERKKGGCRHSRSAKGSGHRN